MNVKKNSPRDPITILMAEDDPEDRMLAQEGLEESRLSNSCDAYVTVTAYPPPSFLDHSLREGNSPSFFKP